jgi:hypothetical protein
VKKLLFFFVLFPIAAQAQTIHQYPYDANVIAYTSPSAYPNISNQCHWRRANNLLDNTVPPQIQSPSLGHTHLEFNFPIYAELGSDVTVPFTIMAFHVDGEVSLNEEFNPNVSLWAWDTPTGAKPIMTGDPAGLKMWTGHATFNIHATQPWVIPDRGWANFIATIETHFTNGSVTVNELDLPFYSVRAPNEETDNQIILRSECRPKGPNDTSGWNFELVDYVGYLPILSPITSSTPPAPMAATYGYGQGPTGFAETRYDLNLHMGIAGILHESAGDNGNHEAILPHSPFDPAALLALGSGVHKVATIWGQFTTTGDADFEPNEQVSTLLVASVTVGAASAAAPTLASITPTSAQQGSTVPVMLMGNHFVAGATTINVPAGVSVSNVVVSSASMLTATFVLAPSVTGPISVSVTTGNGTSGAVLFTVVPVQTQTWQPTTVTYERLIDSLLGPLNQIRTCTTTDHKCTAAMPVQ